MIIFRALFIGVSLLLAGCAVATPFGLMQENTTYIIQRDYDLGGKVIKIPKGCKLKFKGGSFRNGTLIGDSTSVFLKQSSPAFENVSLEGSFNAKSFSINAFCSNKLDYFYGFIQAFSGTKLYLTEDYSVMEYLGILDGTKPLNIEIDGNGHKMALYSFGAYNINYCCLKDITIECVTNINPPSKWKNDKFNFGIVGKKGSSLYLNNVTFTKECGAVYIRGFDKLEISKCNEIGSYFFIYDCNNVDFYNNTITDAGGGYYSIGKQLETGRIYIHNNKFHNIGGGCVILSGGLKYNVCINNNILDNVGCGSAMQSCINIHPRGAINVSNNRIIANQGARTIDIDAAISEYYSDETTVFVENNEIENVEGDSSLHSMALVGLGKLYFRNNTIKDQSFYFWDTPYMEFEGNKVSFSKGFDVSTTIGKMSTHETTENKHYNHIYKNNVFDIPYAKSYVKIEYNSKAAVKIEGVENVYTKRIDFVDLNRHFDAKGDIKLYK